MKYNSDWNDYKVLATGGGMKLEKWGEYTLLRPDPQIIWPPAFDLYKYKGLSAYYERHVSGGGKWNYNQKIPEKFTVSWKGLTFSLKLMGFKHTGLFPEQAVNWETMMSLIKAANASRKEPVRVLNLFAYTGGATVACAHAGASVCHVDAAKAMVDRAKENAALSNCADASIRYIVDDCLKFVNREVKRGSKYDAIIMDPPSFGRGPSNELWKLEDSIFELVKTTAEVMSDTPVFHLINSYTTGLQPTVLKNIQQLVFKSAALGSLPKIDAYEVGLPTEEDIVLPCGASSLAAWL